MAMDVQEVLRSMADGEAGRLVAATGAIVSILRVDADTFRIQGGPMTSYPNTCRLLWRYSGFEAYERVV
jgi:hypothetical protein